MECVNNRRSGVFFLNAPGGTGKSFVLNLLLDTVRANSEIALAVASSGIAATVLHGGRTAHNMFKIPIMEHNEVKSYSIKLNSELARLIKMTSLIVWDEVVMTNKNTIIALDCTAKDITGNKHCFMGGILFVCAGDFRQILPVIRGGGMNEELKYNIKNAFFWEDLCKFKLVQNVRLKAEDKENRTFAENLLLVSMGETGRFRFPKKFGILVRTRDDVIEKLYEELEPNANSYLYFKKKSHNMS
ncbi:ATP-dependent DNA helicase Pif1-like [Oratosquilla oratoria]|uniref:ATP-dependent DNA helicase Pif1-like n=1 Tax=Oratosquilla oratoria TaxID=337810 RepID=UPI003F7740C5